MNFIEIIKAIIYGIVEGITEWLPISSTGHLILVEKLLKLDVAKNNPEYWNLFLVVIQLGAILAVVQLFWNKIFPFSLKKGEPIIKKDIFVMWFKIVVACIPAAIVGLLWSDEFDKLFYNYTCVAIALIVVGIVFILIENLNKEKKSKINNITEITFKAAFIIGIFQLVAAVFPGTSRSGATIIGAMLLGTSRAVAAEFTFYLAIPVMFGASLLKIFKYGFAFTGPELIILLISMVVSYLVSIFVIKFLMGYIKKHDFKVFGWYRIALGIVVLLLGYLVL